MKTKDTPEDMLARASKYDDGLGEDGSWISIQEVADHTGYSTDTIRRWIREKKLAASMPSLRAGYRIQVGEVRRVMREHNTIDGTPDKDITPPHMHRRSKDGA